MTIEGIDPNAAGQEYDESSSSTSSSKSSLTTSSLGDLIPPSSSSRKKQLKSESESGSESESDSECESESSVVYDNVKELWSCRYCRWTYPNPRPSARHKREHRRHCSKFQEEWLEKSYPDLKDGSAISSKDDHDSITMVTPAVYKVEGTFTESEGDLDNRTMMAKDEAESGITNSACKSEDGNEQVTTMVEAKVAPVDIVSGRWLVLPTETVADTQKLLPSDGSEVPVTVVQPDNLLPSDGSEVPATPVTVVQPDNLLPPDGFTESEGDLDNRTMMAKDEAESGITNSACKSEDGNEQVTSGTTMVEAKVAPVDIVSGRWLVLPTETVADTQKLLPSEVPATPVTVVQPDNLLPSDGSEVPATPVTVVQPDNLPKESSKTKIEYVEFKGESSSLNEEAVDLEKILKEQTSHHLLCPNCGSCITRRVILRKRKRVGTPEKQQEKSQKVGDEITQASAAVVEEESTETEDWGCFACFTVFYRRVRSTSIFKRKALPESESDEVHCLSFLLPSRTGKGLESSEILQVSSSQTSEQASSSQTTRELLLSLPWTKGKKQIIETEGEIKVHIDLTKPQQDAEMPNLTTSVHSDGAPYIPFSCMPIMFPPYWKEGEHVEENKFKANSNCLPIVLPAYWGSYIREESNLEHEERASFNCFSWESTTEENERAGFNCLPLQFTATSKQQAEPTAVSSSHGLELREDEEQKSKDGTSSGCLPIFLPKYDWGGTEVRSETEDKSTCLPILLPSYKWHPPLKSEAKEALPSAKVHDENTENVLESAEELESTKLPVSFPVKLPEQKQYITRETRIQAWIKTITNVVTVRPSWKKTKEDEVIDTVQVGNTSTYVDMKLTDQPDGKKEKEVLTTAQSTGWALLDALSQEERKLTYDELTAQEEDEGARLVRKPKKREISSVEDGDEKNDGVTKIMEAAEEDEIVEEPVQEAKAEVPKHVHPKEITPEDLSQPLLSPSEKVLNVNDFIEALSQHQYPDVLVPGTKAPATVSVETPGSFVRVTGDDSKQTIETAIDIAEGIGAITREPRPRPEKTQEYVKSIVYGGLDISLASLAVVSSAAGAQTKTINLLAMSVANLFATFVTLLINMGSLHRTDPAAFEQKVGQSLWLNGSIAVVSFLVCGCIPPVTYAFSFRKMGDSDYKFAATAVATLACIVLLGIGKAYVQKKRYLKTVLNLVITGFAAAVTGYFVGDYLKRWLQKMGFEDNTPPSPTPPPPPPPLFPDWPGLGQIGDGEGRVRLLKRVF